MHVSVSFNFLNVVPFLLTVMQYVKGILLLYSR